MAKTTSEPRASRASASFRPPDTGLLAVVKRSGDVESWHRGALVVVEGDRVTLSIGDPGQQVFCRSTTKPMQALPLLESPAAAGLDFNSRQLALLSASHNGTPEHADVAEQILAKGKLTEADLRCGAHAPFDRKAAFALARAGQRANRLHNNCSGKHAGFLLLAQSLGEDTARYLEPDSKTQQAVRGAVQDLCEVPDLQLHTGVDGCGAPTFRMPLVNLAKGFANFTNPAGLRAVRRSACQDLLAAISKRPVHLAGEGRLCTELVRALPGRIYPKNGAEGVYALGLPGRNIGIAVKVEDGHERGYQPVILELLRRLDVLQDVSEGLRDFLNIPVRNTQALVVGEVTCAVSWPQ